MEVEGSKPRELTVKGTLFPAKWNESNEVVRLLIDTTDQDEYLIGPNQKGREMLALVHRDVEIVGTVKEGENGAFVLNVSHYRLLDSPPEPPKPNQDVLAAESH